MSTNAVQSAAYNTYAYEGNLKETDFKETTGADASIFTGNAKNASSSDFEYACTDGDNDGKLGIGEFCKSAFKGVAKLVATPVTEALKGNFKPLIGTVAAGAVIGVLGAPAMIAAGVVGVATGGAMLVDGGIKYFSAENDGDAKQAAEQIGAGGFTFLSSLFAVKSGAKTLKKSNDTHLGQYYDENGKLLRDASGRKIKPSLGEKAKAYGQDLGESFGKAGKRLTGGLRREGASERPTAADEGTPHTDISDEGTPLGTADDGVPVTGDGTPDVPLTGDGTPDVPITGDGTPDVPLTGDGTPDVPLTGDGAQPQPQAGQGQPQPVGQGTQPEIRPFEPRQLTPEEIAAGGQGGEGQTLGDTSLLDDILRMGQEQLDGAGAGQGGQVQSPMPNPSDLNAGGAAPAANPGSTGKFGEFQLAQSKAQTAQTKLNTIIEQGKSNGFSSDKVINSKAYTEWKGEYDNAQAVLNDALANVRNMDAKLNHVSTPSTPSKQTFLTMQQKAINATPYEVTDSGIVLTSNFGFLS